MRAAALLLLAATPAAAQPAPSFGTAYVCEGGAVLRVAYLNPEQGDAMAVLDWGGALVPMRQYRTGSGVAYADMDEERGLRWRAKGDEGYLGRRAADDEAEEERVLSGCRRVGR